MSAASRRRFRLLLVAAGTLLLTILSVWEGVACLGRGTCPVPSRRVSTIVSMSDQPSVFVLLLAGYLAASVIFAFVTVLVVRAAFVSGSIDAHEAGTGVLKGLQRRAPCGLKPLWVGHLIAGTCFALYVLVS